MPTLTKDAVDAALDAYDGRQVRTLRGLISVVAPPEAVMMHIIARCQDEEARIQSGASWLVKNFLEAGARLNAAQTKALIASYGPTVSWDACLHHCQSMRWLTIPESAMAEVGEFIGRCTGAPEPFVRAWAYDALFQITRADPMLLADTVDVLQDAEEDPAPSVRARVRALLKASGAAA